MSYNAATENHAAQIVESIGSVLVTAAVMAVAAGPAAAPTRSIVQSELRPFEKDVIAHLDVLKSRAYAQLAELKKKAESRGLSSEKTQELQRTNLRITVLERHRTELGKQAELLENKLDKSALTTPEVEILKPWRSRNLAVGCSYPLETGRS